MKDWIVFVCLLVFSSEISFAGTETKLNGYAEWRHGSLLIVDGERVFADKSTKFKGNGDAKSFETIPIGYEVKIKGDRKPDGLVYAKEIEAKPNGTAMYEDDLKKQFDQMENLYKQQGKMFEESSDGKEQD